MTVHAFVDLRIDIIRLRKMVEFTGVFGRFAMAARWLNISNVRSACSRVRSGLNQPSLGASPTWASSSGGTPHATRIRTGRPRASEHLIVAQESRLIWRIEQPSPSAAT
jgi:hypothetical protein